MNVATGAVRPIGATGIYRCNGLAFEPGTGRLFAVGYDSSFFNLDLFTLNTATGVATPVGVTSASGALLDDLAFRSDGTLFSSRNPNVLLTVDTVNRAVVRGRADATTAG